MFSTISTERVNIGGDGYVNYLDERNFFTKYAFIKASHCTL